MNVHYTRTSMSSSTGYTNDPVGIYPACTRCNRAASTVFPEEYLVKARPDSIPEERNLFDSAWAAEAAALWEKDNPSAPSHPCCEEATGCSSPTWCDSSSDCFGCPYEVR